jgi:hypothetical protein
MRCGGRKVLAGLGLVGLHDFRILKQVLAVEVQLQESFHRDAVEVALGILEIVGKRREIGIVIGWRFQARIVLQRLCDVGQEIAVEIGVDNVLLDIDHVIDAGSGFHVLDGLVVHLVPGRGFDLDLDAGLCFKILCEHVLDVV